ncbi:MAG: chemotaxis protein CheA [Desulfonauticus sp.]|nr:chemotaxis protein CheA [Desulfonauticus sp.]
MDELLKEFINETRELVENASQTFLEIDKDPDNLELINELFRVIHTIKGSSGIFEFLTPLNKAVHVAEDVLDRAREGELKLNSEIVDLYLDLLDQINEWLDEVEDSGELGSEAEEISRGFQEKFSALLGEKENKDTGFEQEQTSSQSAEASELDLPWLLQIEDKIRQDVFLSCKSDDLLAVEYIPEEGSFFVGEDPILTVKNTPSLLGVKANFTPPEDRESFDPFVCKMSFYVFTEASEQEIKEHYLYVEEQTKVYSLPLDALIFPCGEQVEPDLVSDFLQEAGSFIQNENWMELVDRVNVALEIIGEDTFIASCLIWIKTIILSQKKEYLALVPSFLEAIKTGTFIKMLKKQPPRVDKSDSDSTVYARELTDHDLALCVDLLKTQLKVLSGTKQKELESGVIKSVQKVLKQILLCLDKKELAAEVKEKGKDVSGLEVLLKQLIDDLVNEHQNKVLSKEEELQTKKAPSPAPAKPSQKPEDKTIKSQHSEIKVLKVDKVKIDALMELVSELVVAKNALPYLAKKAEEVFGSREMGRELKVQYGTINRICEELQNAVMQIRMVPVAHVFQRFPRLVRDLSKKLHKKINLVMEGEDTKADKTVVEDLAEPMVHLIRNSIDHGIESPEERKDRGKPETGTIILRATQLDDQILVEIIDDGRGIDPEKVKRKAYEKGLISEEDLDKMSDEQALQLILAPGFSTAEQVSELSGRGVGMDVVKTFVESLGGTINILSQKGRGTTIQIYLPLSMAVTRVLTVEVAGDLFGVPIENVAETVKVAKQDVKTIKNREVIVLREKIIPIYHLDKLLQLRSGQIEIGVEDEDLAVLVLQLKNKELGLVVDKFHEDIDIILKPLEGLMENYTLYSGATLLGDGRVLLVINPKEIEKWL